MPLERLVRGVALFVWHFKVSFLFLCYKWIGGNRKKNTEEGGKLESYCNSNKGWWCFGQSWEERNRWKHLSPRGYLREASAIDRLKMRGKRKMNLAYSELLVLSNWKREVSLCRGKENVEMHVWRLKKKKMKTINKHMETKAGKGGWDESGDWDWHIYNSIYNIDN